MARSYTYFDVFGPYEIPVVKEIAGRYISNGCPNFWKEPEPSEFRKERGCYLFALRAAKGYKPVYIGMATRTFGQECFQPHKIAGHYNPSLAKAQRGTPVMFFLVAERKRERVNKSTLMDLERTMIRWAGDKNPELSNKNNKTVYTWGIHGVEGGKVGKPGRAAQQFRKAIGY